VNTETHPGSVPQSALHLLEMCGGPTQDRGVGSGEQGELSADRRQKGLCFDEPGSVPILEISRLYDRDVSLMNRH
jgi:hypothetical protein